MENKYISKIRHIAKGNKWTKIYISLVERAISRGSNRQIAKITYGYIESHHILPKSFKMGGERDLENMVLLTAREHFIVHMCAVKMFEGVFSTKMNFAFNQLKAENEHQKRYFNSRFYNLAKTNKREYVRLYYLDQVKYFHKDELKNIEDFVKNGWSKSMTEEFKAGRVGNMKGKKHSEETRAKMSAASKGKEKPHLKGGKMSEESKIKRRETMLKIKNEDPYKYQEIYKKAVETNRKNGAFERLRLNPPMLGKKMSQRGRDNIAEAQRNSAKRRKEEDPEAYNAIVKARGESIKRAWDNKELREKASLYNSKIYKMYKLTQEEFYCQKIKPLIMLGFLPSRIAKILSLSTGTILLIMNKYISEEEGAKFRETLLSQRRNYKIFKENADKLSEIHKKQIEEISLYTPGT
jgi:hypothetical protein